MAQDCPLCFSKGVFAAWNQLKDALVSLSTRTFTCPLCFSLQEGLDKFTLHLVSHEMETKIQKQEEVCFFYYEGTMGKSLLYQIRYQQFQSRTVPTLTV